MLSRLLGRDLTALQKGAGRGVVRGVLIFHKFTIYHISVFQTKLNEKEYRKPTTTNKNL